MTIDYSNPHETCSAGYELGLEQGRIEGAAVAAGILLMALEIAARDRSPWTCGDCGREDLTWEPWCPCPHELPKTALQIDNGMPQSGEEER